MNLNCLTLSKWVSRHIWQAYHKKSLKLYFLCTYDDKMKILQRFCLKLSLTKFSLVFFPLFSKEFTNICKIYGLPKIYNKIPKMQAKTCLNNNNNLPGQCSAFSVVSDVVHNVYKKSWRLLSFNENIQICNTSETVR